VSLEDIERAVFELLDALGPAPRADPLHVLTLPDRDRAGRVGEFYGNPASFYGNPRTRTFAELLIDCEEDRTCGWCWWGCCGTLTDDAIPKGDTHLGGKAHAAEADLRWSGGLAKMSGIASPPP